jgi:sugar transferase (PEP-CTERM/EpsH1 system associated)
MASARHAADRTKAAPLVAHIVFSLDVGGLENGLVNLINRMPEGYRHAVICLSHYSDFRARIKRPDVQVFALHKRPGKDFGLYVRLWRLLRRLRPDIVHTRNYGTLDSQAVAALANVPFRVHGEHGWDMVDLHGERLKYKLLRRALGPLIQRHVAVSADLGRWLTERVGISAERVSEIRNVVDTERFYPAAEQLGSMADLAGDEFGPDKFIIGTVGRLDAVKDQASLIRAFAQLVHECPAVCGNIRLAIIGDGPLRADLRALVEQEELLPVCWMPGSRDDIELLLRRMNLFVLPSLNEGISNTLLEAMASGLPVIATNVGGNPELIQDGETGILTPPADTAALARAMERYATDPEAAAAAGRAGRRRVEQNFSLRGMVAAYTKLYDEVRSGHK